ncbi:NAD(P)-dependent oxidoreductase [Francisella sp. 19X1-34]|uniref:NAD(P)-dependent oxidoreductase n=1 Tax=Francisella sp. 19X1-34 TaxID=3087177 RepID=UPI002E309012|nr:NAD(P)-dependent oxidoreductase [Francisella sp. 19X1-34]MED7789310.1 NAD(P)-dependent oxidoreductase [Francisella sp. 19X1-34]
MLKFTNIIQESPKKRKSTVRKKDFHEIYKEFASKKALEQASRCSQCGIPFCQVHCPLSNNIPDWLKLVAEDRLEEAYQLSQSTNNFPEICGRVCPQDKLCEGNCVIQQSGHGTVTIGSIEKFITETAWSKGWIKPIKPSKERSQSIGIIGAGPSGLVCAEQLRKYGFQVIIYDKYDRPGGLLVYGIPNFKLEKDVVTRRVQLLENSGVKFVNNINIGIDITFDDLRDKHDAILISTGVYKTKDINIPRNDLKGVVPALDFLINSNKIGFNDNNLSIKNELNAKDKDVVVIGGGDTAMDCLRTAIRQKARSVKCIYRRDRLNMPGSSTEVSNAREEGVEFIWLSNPKEFLGEKHVSGLAIEKMKLGEPDKDGRRSPIAIKDSKTVLNTNMVITALGFDPEDLPKLFDQDELRITSRGTINIDTKTMQSSIPGVFAAGDIVRGSSLVVWAIKDGRDAAKSIFEYLESLENKAYSCGIKK